VKTTSAGPRHAAFCPLDQAFCALSGTTPARLPLPPYFLQLVQLFFEVRFFLLLSAPALAIPVLNVRNVVFHSVVTSNPPAPYFFIFILQFCNLLFCCSYLV